MRNHYLLYITFLLLCIAPNTLKAQFPGNPNTYAGPVSLPENPQKVQLALVLDASGSMKDMLTQAQSELWYMVNEVLMAYEGYEPPQIELALMEYGRRRAGKRNDYVRVISPFTADLDWVADQLYAMRTGGWNEYAGAAIQHATSRMGWSSNPRDLKFLFIAGNESFKQGPVKYQAAISRAVAQGITVNTIFAGDYQKGIRHRWKEAARLGQGEYFSLENGPLPRYTPSPYDYRLSELDGLYNRTYIPYGAYGADCWNRYNRLDNYAYGYRNPYIRTYVKCSPTYVNPRWDLIDAIDCGYVRIEDIDRSQLPRDYRNLSPRELENSVNELRDQRNKIKREVHSIRNKNALRDQLSGTMGQGRTAPIENKHFNEIVGRVVQERVKTAANNGIIRKPPVEGRTSPDQSIDTPPKDDSAPGQIRDPKIPTIGHQDKVLREEKLAQEREERIRESKAIEERVRQKRIAEEREERAQQVRAEQQREERVRQESVAKEQEERAQQVRAVQQREERARQESIAKEQEERAQQVRAAQQREERARQESIAKEREERAQQVRAAQQREERARQESIAKEREERAQQVRAAQQREERARQESIAKEREERARQARAEQQREERARQARVEQQREERARQARAEQQREERARQARVEQQREERARQARVEQQREERARQARVEQQREERARQARANQQREERARQAKAAQERTVKNAAAKETPRRPSEGKKNLPVKRN